MGAVGVLYVGSYQEAEEAALEGALPTIRVAPGQRPAGLAASEQWIVRAKRLSLLDYAAISEHACSAGAALSSSPLAYAIVSSLRAGAVAVDDRGPRMVVVSAEDGPGELRRRALEESLSFPLFLRADAESAAKYVGVEGCLIFSSSLEDFAAAVGNVEAHVKGYTEIAVKEVWPIKKLGATRHELQYRAYGYRGRLISFDYLGSSVLPPPDPALARFADEVFASLSLLGADGLHAIDVAVRDSDRRLFIVEWKDLSSASLASGRSALPAIARRISERMGTLPQTETD